LDYLFTCSIMTDGIWSKVEGRRLISFIIFDNRIGISFRRKLKDSASVAFLPKSTNCWMESGDGLYWAKVSRSLKDLMSNNLVRLRETGANLMAAIGISLGSLILELSLFKRSSDFFVIFSLTLGQHVFHSSEQKEGTWKTRKKTD